MSQLDISSFGIDRHANKHCGTPSGLWVQHKALIVLGSNNVKIRYRCIAPYLRRKQTTMGSHAPPSLYLDPPDHDISLDEFVTLPKRRLEAIRLLRSGEIAVEPEDSNNVGEMDTRQAFTVNKVYFPINIHITVHAPVIL